jgi:hypothetical protein
VRLRSVSSPVAAVWVAFSFLKRSLGCIAADESVPCHAFLAVAFTDGSSRSSNKFSFFFLFAGRVATKL